MDPDDGFFSPGLKGLIVVLGLAVVVLAAVSLKPTTPAPPAITGCYVTERGPNIVVDQQFLTVMQERPLKRRYTLDYSKGWAITIKPGFDWVIGPNGQIDLKAGYPHGEYLIVSGEHDRTPGVLDFELPSTSLMLKTTYAHSGKECEPARR